MPTTYAIPDGRTAFAATLWTGNSTTGRAITGVGFAPDFAWIKNRSVGYSNNLTDTVRGATKLLFSNNTDPEATTPIHGYIGAFTSDGYTLTNGSSTNGYVNDSGSNYVGWNWKAGGTAVTNNTGTIQSSVSANTTAGFSVVTYTGIGGNVSKTFGHGCQVNGTPTAPSMVIVKGRDTGSTGVNDWVVWHSAFTGSEYIYLDLTNAKATSANYWGATVPSSTVVTVGGNSSNISNESGIKYVAYCFAAVAGYSAFGSYTGNGDPNGPFVYLGFRPRFVMLKRTDPTGGAWTMVDSSRNPYNVEDNQLYANYAYTEAGASNTIDALSNGFKLRELGSAINASGGTYIYMAFAEVPFKFANAR